MLQGTRETDGLSSGLELPEFQHLVCMPESRQQGVEDLFFRSSLNDQIQIVRARCAGAEKLAAAKWKKTLDARRSNREGREAHQLAFAANRDNRKFAPLRELLPPGAKPFPG